METSRLIFPQTIIKPIDNGAAKTPAKKAGPVKSDFRNILDQSLGVLKFSRHAQERLQSRDIQLSADDMQSLSTAIARAKEKGARDSLVLMGDLAFVVSIKNNTVITAVDGASIKENVFTNIDSTVIV